MRAIDYHQAVRCFRVNQLHQNRVSLNRAEIKPAILQPKGCDRKM